MPVWQKPDKYAPFSISKDSYRGITDWDIIFGFLFLGDVVWWIPRSVTLFLDGNDDTSFCHLSLLLIYDYFRYGPEGLKKVANPRR